MFAFFGQLIEETGGAFRNDLHDVVANDGHAVALVTHSAERGGKKLTVRASPIQHISGGSVTESWWFPEDQYAVDELWGW